MGHAWRGLPGLAAAEGERNRAGRSCRGGRARVSASIPCISTAAALLAAHVAASLDAAISLQRERRSAVTDSLTGILNRRGLEERLDRELALAQERRMPLSLFVIDCDDFKEINDRAGHEFGDALLHEVARVLVHAIPEGAEAARLGGDEFVVMLPGAGADAAEALGGEVRGLLAAGLTDAGFPLRISAGISTYPFDGASASALLRAADQALYSAKSAGRNRVASFRDVVRGASADVVTPGRSVGGDAHRRGRGEGSVLTDVVQAAAAIEAETTVEALCDRLCKSLVFVVGATACSASRVVGEYLVNASEHSLREISLGNEAAYRISDFPLTAEALRTGEPRAVSFLHGDVDPAEAFILRELGDERASPAPPRVSTSRPWGFVGALRDAAPRVHRGRHRHRAASSPTRRSVVWRRWERTPRPLAGPRSTSFLRPPSDDTPRTPRTR